MAAAAGLLAEIPFFIGTLSKSLGSQGGFAAVSREIADLLWLKLRVLLGMEL